jgi:hypothetical protein
METTVPYMINNSTNPMVQEEAVSMDAQNIQNIDNPEETKIAAQVAEAVNAQKEEVNNMENQEIPVQVKIGDEEQSFFTKDNAIKVGLGIGVGVAAKYAYDRYQEDQQAAAELSAAVADLF